MKKMLVLGVLLLMFSLTFVIAATNVTKETNISNVSQINNSSPRPVAVPNFTEAQKAEMERVRAELANRTGSRAGLGAPGLNNKNMTYGQCVSSFAQIKNQCKELAKNATSNCDKETRFNMSAEQKALCKASAGNRTSQCQSDFKTAKAECAKIKHNFFETLGSMFK